MTNSLRRTILYGSFASTTELANLHIHKLDAAGIPLSEARHPAYDSLKAAGRTVELHIYAQEGVAPTRWLRSRHPLSWRRPHAACFLSVYMGVDLLHPGDVGCLHLSPGGENVKDRYRNRIELLQGTLDLLVLQTLRWGPQHGYGISRAIQSRSGDILRVDTGSLYPALHRLERKKWIAADWKTSENKQRVRVYRLTAKGRTQLADERSRWDQISCAIAGILNAPKKEFET
jgi:PadR family transcriptional regulator, regulatory protein PadR